MIYCKALFLVFLFSCCIEEKIWAMGQADILEQSDSMEEVLKTPAAKKTKWKESSTQDTSDDNQFSTPSSYASSSTTLTPSSISSGSSLSSLTSTPSTPFVCDRINKTEGVSTEKRHYFESFSAEKGTYHDSRSFHETLRVFDYPFEDWHKEQIKILKELTPQVRKALKYPGKPMPNTNLLRYRMDLLIGEKESQIPVIETDSTWVSGWPSKISQNTLTSEEFKKYNFQFISSMIPNFDDLSEVEKSSALSEYLRKGYCLDRESFLISQRLKHQKENLERAERETPHLNQMYLHTEQGLMLYFASEEVKKKLQDALGKLASNDQEHDSGKNIQITCVVNLSSSRSVCMNCADRLFRESEWGMGFFSSFEDIIKQEFSQYRLKLYFLVSAFDQHADLLSGTTELLKHYKSLCSKSEHPKFGFSGNKISFCEKLDTRQRFDHQKPLIGHAIFPIVEGA